MDISQDSGGAAGRAGQAVQFPDQNVKLHETRTGLKFEVKDYGLILESRHHQDQSAQVGNTHQIVCN